MGTFLTSPKGDIIKEFQQESHWQGLPELQSSNFHPSSEGDPKHDSELETTYV